MPQQLRWGVISTADIGRMQVIPAIQGSTWGRVEVLASRNVEKARSVARELGIRRVADSYEALLADPEVDAVYIPLPNTMHAEWTIRAAEAGKAVLCEKPLATSASDAQRAIDACAKHGVSLMEAFMYRFHPQTRRIQELIASGVIGQVREVRAHLSVNIMRALQTGNIRSDRQLGGGALLDMGCYSVSIARMAFGSEPQRVLGRMHIDPKMGVDTSAAGILEFANGVALLSCSFATDGGDIYTVVGSGGYIEVPRGIIPGYGTRAGEGLIIVVDPDGNRREERIEPANQYRIMADAFAESVLNRRPAPLLPEDGLNNMKVLDALARSSANNTSEPV
jgi:D-xylose 1-dehydrogenase (NADP+, D-xylono-1,5-lactone-forming)